MLGERVSHAEKRVEGNNIAGNLHADLAHDEAQMPGDQILVTYN
jgi:hypothetical protein